LAVTSTAGAAKEGMASPARLLTAAVVVADLPLLPMDTEMDSVAGMATARAVVVVVVE